MNSEFSMPGKPQCAATSHNPLTTLKPLPQLRLTEAIKTLPEPLEEAGHNLEIPKVSLNANRSEKQAQFS